jgi:hypothetical protein
MRARQHISDIRLDRLTIRGPHIPAASELEGGATLKVCGGITFEFFQLLKRR